MEVAVDADDEDGVATGLVALVVTVVELVVEAMEREAVRRMEAGDLTDAEVERVGSALMSVEDELDRIKEREDIVAETRDLRTDLDGLVERALARVDDEAFERRDR